jgi:hypothetical protein
MSYADVAGLAGVDIRRKECQIVIHRENARRVPLSIFQPGLANVGA